jgi:hypothetical protein
MKLEINWWGLLIVIPMAFIFIGFIVIPNIKAINQINENKGKINTMQVSEMSLNNCYSSNFMSEQEFNSIYNSEHYYVKMVGLTKTCDKEKCCIFINNVGLFGAPNCNHADCYLRGAE